MLVTQIFDCECQVRDPVQNDPLGSSQLSGQQNLGGSESDGDSIVWRQISCGLLRSLVSVCKVISKNGQVNKGSITRRKSCFNVGDICESFLPTDTHEYTWIMPRRLITPIPSAITFRLSPRPPMMNCPANRLVFIETRRRRKDFDPSRRIGNIRDR